MKQKQARVILAKNGFPGQVMRMEAQKKIRVFFKSHGIAVYFPIQDTVIDESGEFHIDIRCDPEFAAASVPPDCIVAEDE